MDDRTHGTGLPFWKYHGTGNDFVMLDNRDGQLTNYVTSGLARRLCDRHLGVGGDGLIVLERTGSQPSDAGYDFRMAHFNSDGSVGALCGNGARCAVSFALELSVQPSRSGHWRFLDRDRRALDGFLIEGPSMKGVTQIGVRMPNIDRVQVVNTCHTSGYLVDTGCPHYVVYVENEAALDRMDVHTSGSALRCDARFRAIGGTNVDFVCQKADDDDAEVIRVRTFERGVQAETLSCGTGAVAVAVVDLYRKLIGTPEASSNEVTSCTYNDVCKSAEDVDSNNDVAVSGKTRKCNVITNNDVTPSGDVMRKCVARSADVTDTEGDATSMASDVNVYADNADAVGRDETQDVHVDVVCADWAGPLNAGIGRQRSHVRHVESRGGRLTVMVDCQVDETTGEVVFRNVFLSGPTTKVFCGRFLQDYWL